MVHPCGKPSKRVSGYLRFCYFSISNRIQLDSAGFVLVFHCTALAGPESLLSHAGDEQSNSVLAVILGVLLFTAPAWVEVVDYLLPSSSRQDPLHSTCATERFIHWRAAALTALCGWCTKFHITNFTGCIGGNSRLQFFDCCYESLQWVNFTWLWKVF